MHKTTSNFAGIVVWILFIGNLFLSCRRQPAPETQHKSTIFEGSWEKVGTSKCSQIYPDVVEFSPNGIYQTQSELTSIQMAWDSGTYEVSEHVVKISNALEVSKTYRFVFKNEIVTFEDDDGCKFAYRRM